MLLFFGFVGLFGVIILLPGFPLLHYGGLERFQVPTSKRVVNIILVKNCPLPQFPRTLTGEVR